MGESSALAQAEILDRHAGISIDGKVEGWLTHHADALRLHAMRFGSPRS